MMVHFRSRFTQEQLDRIPVEGKFGNAKRKGTLQRIMAKLSHTSESVIHIGITVLNLDQKLREVLFTLIYELQKTSKIRVLYMSCDKGVLLSMFNAYK